MSGVDALIDGLASDARPVRPLEPPLRRALAWLAVASVVGGLAVYQQGDARQLLTRYAGREVLMAVEMAAMLATAVLAVVGAFFVSIPGGSRRWLLAPLPPLGAWLLLSGAGCYLAGGAGSRIGASLDCLIYIVAVSLMLAVPLVWLLARARPIEPLQVACLGGLGSAALAAFTLQFFHPAAVTFLDLAAHLIAVALVVGVAALLNRRALSPA